MIVVEENEPGSDSTSGTCTPYGESIGVKAQLRGALVEEAQRRVAVGHACRCWRKGTDSIPDGCHHYSELPRKDHVGAVVLFGSSGEVPATVDPQ